MASMFIWMLSIALGVAIMIVSAASAQPLIHMGTAAIISILIAILAIIDNRQLHAAGTSSQTIAASTARYMGMVWVWGALSLFVTYYFILKWNEWLGFFLAFAVAGGLCLFVSNTLARDAESGREDETMMKIARYLTMAQLVGMVITVIGLLVDGKMTRYLTPRFTDWAANNIFFFGAVALTAISLNALLTSRSKTVAS
ncbi:MAG: hypothetical protein CTY20_15070 [Hyphomicrobium sp.]|nr:MAG: hypothetical protein CTY20_15070 [Hyphomicrobium sp.]